VLGCGIDRDYPASSAALSRRIEENGLVVSEYEPGVEPGAVALPGAERLGRLDKPFPLNHAVVLVVHAAKCRARVAWVRPGNVLERWLPSHASAAKVAKDEYGNNDDDDDPKPGRQ
jgi:hypothetical protein